MKSGLLTAGIASAMLCWVGLGGEPDETPGDFRPPQYTVHRSGSPITIDGKTNMQYSQWSKADTPMPNFHTPHRFGKIIFAKGSSPFGR